MPSRLQVDSSTGELSTPSHSPLLFTSHLLYTSCCMYICKYLLMVTVRAAPWRSQTADCRLLASPSDRNSGIGQVTGSSSPFGMLTRLISGRSLILQRISSRVNQPLYPHSQLSRIRRSMANLSAERFLADRYTPVCSLDVAKSFAQLRFDRITSCRVLLS